MNDFEDFFALENVKFKIKSIPKHAKKLNGTCKSVPHDIQD